MHDYVGGSNQSTWMKLHFSHIKWNNVIKRPTRLKEATYCISVYLCLYVAGHKFFLCSSCLRFSMQNFDIFLTLTRKMSARKIKRYYKINGMEQYFLWTIISAECKRHVFYDVARLFIQCYIKSTLVINQWLKLIQYRFWNYHITTL